MKTSIINIVRRFRWLNRSIRTWLLYTILCALGLCQFGCAYAQLKGASINDRPISRGESLGIEVIREGEQIMPKLGLSLEKGDEIKTPPGVTAFISFGSGSEVIMMPETHIKIESIFVWFGKAIITIKGKFKTKTKLVTGSHSGTVFILTVDRNDQAVIQMLEGGINLQSNTGPWSVFLKSGQEASIFSGEEREIVPIPRSKYNNLVEFINKTKLSIGISTIRMIVPDVIGLQQNRAQSVLGTYEFRIGKVTKTIDIEGDYGIGDIVRQRPESGKELKRKGSVDIWVLARAVYVPNVVGQHLNEAMSIIRSRGLVVDGNVRKTITGQYEPGIVNAQSPNAGQRVMEGTAVRLTVEEESVVIPDVRGRPVEQAESEIRGRRLNVRRTNAGLDSDIRIPQVVGQDPASGSRVKPGKTVTLRVAEPGVRVPNVIGRHQKEAANLLSQSNLRVGNIRNQYHNQYQAGFVIQQSPGAGQVVRPGSTVALTVSRGRDPRVPVPNLFGLSKDAALQRLESRKLRPGGIKYEYRRGSRIGVVIEQNPQAEQLVMPGSVVSFTISVSELR